MKRYIFLSAWCMLFFTAMSFGMDQTKSRCITTNKPLTMTNKYCSLEEIVQRYIKRQRFVADKPKIKFKPGKPLRPLKYSENQFNMLQKQNNENVTEKSMNESSNIDNLQPVTFAYKSDISETKQYGFIVEEVERPEDKELKEIGNELYNHFGRMPTVAEIKTEMERKNFVSKCNEWADNNPEMMEAWKRANDSLFKACLDHFMEPLKKQLEAIKKYEKEHPDLFK